MAILSDAGYQIRIVIQPGGTVVDIFDPNEGKSVGGLNDLNHFAGARKFVTEERKTNSSEEALSEQGAIILFLIDKIKETDKSFVLPALSPEFHIFLRMTAVKMAAIQENLEALEGFPCEGASSEATKLVLTTMSNQMMQVHISALTTFLKEGKLDKGFLQSEYLKYGVPKWFVNRMEGQKIPSMQNPDINRVLFPQSAKAWVSLTLEEWRSDKVLENIKPIMQYSYWVREFLSEDERLKSFCGLGATVDLKDRTVPSVSKLFEAKLNLVPHCMTYEYAFEPASKGRDQGFWVVPRWDTPSDALQSLSQAISRSVLGYVSYSDVISSFWEKLFPSIKFDRSKISKANNIQKIALTAVTDELRTSYTEKLLLLEKPDDRVAFVTLLSDQLKAGQSSPQHIAVARFFGTTAGGQYKKTANSGSSFRVLDKMPERIKTASPMKLLTNLRDIDSSKERQGAIKDILKVFPEKKGNTSRGNLVPRSILGKRAKVFLTRRLTHLENKGLAERMRVWFCAFQNGKMQDAAVSYLEAQFDELFTKQLGIIINSDDEDELSDAESE